ncbi:hypothetical protein BS628_14115 [Agrobacterium radiobacter]|jgi:hypothetical protein|nr:hypothetical protein L902_22025 [Agrobacterium radiobacter DSM 30147]KWT77734.1 hypothetical protein ASH09_09100 [Agrobacterium radiobacter]KWT84785.1 hypothetical protein ASB65_08530 [Agrobacterium tumefaciens str. B6]MQB24727.1 hypothetical protein [Agrobacterium tumefaciens]TGE79259.1 hypothetical protein C9410_14140 [Rhizobium sp. SEMIA 439]
MIAPRSQDRRSIPAAICRALIAAGGTDEASHLFHAAFMQQRVFSDRGSMRNAYSSIEVVDADKGKAGLCLRRKK